MLLPYPPHALISKVPPASSDNFSYPLVFGMMGAASSYGGLEMFLEIANHFRNESRFKFGYTGRFRSLEKPLPPHLVDLLPDAQLPVDIGAYHQRFRSISYGIGLWQRKRNGYAASTSLLDAFNHIKPGIYLSNLNVIDAFESMGDIGYLCNDYDEIIECLNALRDDLPVSRYRQQRETIYANRERFNAENLGGEYRAAIDEFLTKAESD